MIPGLGWMNEQPWTRPALGVLTAVAVLVKYLAPPHTLAHQISSKALDFLAPLVAASVGKSYDLAKPGASVDAEVAARGGPVAVLKGAKDD